MLTRAIGILVALFLLWAVTTHGAQAPTTKDGVPAEYTPAKFHWLRHPDDVDRTLAVTVTDPDGRTATGRVLERSGSIFADRGGPSRIRGTNHFYFIDPRLDIGAVAGFRPAFSGTVGDPFTVGLRVSPVRLAYEFVSPDAIIAKDWVGAGLSFYPPERLVGPDWHHLGAGVWYGYPTRGPDYGGPGWAVGLSFSIR